MWPAVFLGVISCVCADRLELSSGDVKWFVTNKNGSINIPAKVPGGIYSDLMREKVIGDILTGFNDVLTRWVAYDTWTYTTHFNVTEQLTEDRVVNLVLEGVDTVAYIELNESPVGATGNMFVRYVFDIKSYLKDGKNELKVTFLSPVEAANLRSEKHFTVPACVPDVYNGECHVNQLRKMQASFAWDWGPAFPSVGIWKPIYKETYNQAIIRSVTVHTEIVDTSWKLTARIHFESGEGSRQINGHLRTSLDVEGNQQLVKWTTVNVTTHLDGTAEVDACMPVSQNLIRPWWPNGFGDQPLYKLTLRMQPNAYEDADYGMVKHLMVGFRTLEVVEEDASKSLGNTTGGTGLTFYFKINGYPLFMKGSNWIPAHILPELGADEAVVDKLLESARDTHMAMLRVWGGGVYESDYFYEKCDQLGILIWQDFLFACSMYPVDNEFLNSIQTEIEQTVTRLQHHPSIAVWAGNNENEVALRGNWYHTSKEFDKYKAEYIRLYVDTIKPIVESIDPERRYLVSSPSNGKESEDEGYIANNPYDPHYGDTHYYNYLGDNWDMNIYPKTRFASEYGFQSMSSLKTMRTATNDSKDYELHSNYSQHRQHSPNGYKFIDMQLLKRMKLDANDSEYFRKFVFYSQISQAMSIKAETEFYRQSQYDWYTMGALYWQLNDVWQAPSWSSIEYGGKWKMLHYFAKSFFAPVLVSPRLTLAGDIEVYLINDRFVPIIDGQITVDIFNWTSLLPISTQTFEATAEPLSVTKHNTTLDYWRRFDMHTTFARFTLKATGVPFSPQNYVFPKNLKDVVGLTKPTIKITVPDHGETTSDKQWIYTIDIKVDTVVLFLWLDSDLPGRFIDNGLIVTTPQTVIQFVSHREIKPKDLEASITYQYYAN